MNTLAFIVAELAEDLRSLAAKAGKDKVFMQNSDYYSIPRRLSGINPDVAGIIPDVSGIMTPNCIPGDPK